MCRRPAAQRTYVTRLQQRHVHAGGAAVVSACPVPRQTLAQACNGRSAAESCPRLLLGVLEEIREPADDGEVPQVAVTHRGGRMHARLVQPVGELERVDACVCERLPERNDPVVLVRLVRVVDVVAVSALAHVKMNETLRVTRAFRPP
jgi:hypothetical protein